MIHPVHPKANISENNIQNMNSTITVYNDQNNNGWYYFYENGVKKTVYCYEHDKIQPSIYGTDGYTKVDFFSPEVASPNSPVTKEMIATLLYLGFPNNATGLQEVWGVENSRANYLTQQSVWELVKGNITTYLKDYAYEYDLEYYAGEPTSPYFKKYGESGSVSISGDTTLNKIGDLYKTDTINIDGNYTGSFTFENLPINIKIYDANTNQPITNSLTWC